MIFMDFFTLNSLEAFTFIGRLFVNDITSDTVSILFGFNKAFSPYGSQKVMRLHCRHQPSTTLNKNVRLLAFLLSWSGGRVSSASILIP